MNNAEVVDMCGSMICSKLNIVQCLLDECQTEGKALELVQNSILGNFMLFHIKIVVFH